VVVVQVSVVVAVVAAVEVVAEVVVAVVEEVVAVVVLVWVALEEEVVVGNLQPLLPVPELPPTTSWPLPFCMPSKSRHLFSLIPWPWQSFLGSILLQVTFQPAQRQPLSHRTEAGLLWPGLLPQNENVGYKRWPRQKKQTLRKTDTFSFLSSFLTDLYNNFSAADW
jgi:hypothetical protein